MKFFIIGLLIVISSYQSDIDYKEAYIPKQVNAIDSALKINITYPIRVEYTSDINTDTMFFHLGTDRLLVTPNGEAVKNNKLLFEIHPLGNIQKLFPFILGDDIVIIYSFSTLNGESGSSAKRISLKQKNIIWETPIYGFSLVRPVLIGNYTYLSTLGFVGKLDMLNGKFEWQFDNFFKNGNFINFNEPTFYKDSIVLFTEKNPVDTMGCSILIDDRNSCILMIKD